MLDLRNTLNVERAPKQQRSYVDPKLDLAIDRKRYGHCFALKEALRDES